MAPQTRSTAKPSPGRSTRNSVYGRSPLAHAKPHKNLTNTTPAQNAVAHDQGKVTSEVGTTKGTPWLACRDACGVFTTIAVSETGEGIHVRWHYPEDDCKVIEDEGTDVEMAMPADKEHGITPVPVLAAAGPSKTVRHPFPETPRAPQPYDAGSVILTPVKKAKPLQPSPPRIGDKGIRCMYKKDGVLVDFKGRARIVLRHPVGSSANLSREQVERLENEREGKIVQVQVQKLLAEKKRLEEEELLSDSGYEDEMETDVPSSPRNLQRQGPNGTILVSHDDMSDAMPPVSLGEIGNGSSVFRGPNGELLDRHGRQILGREGTILIDSTYAMPRRVMREEALPTLMDFVDHSGDKADLRLRRPRFGPEGTELID